MAGSTAICAGVLECTVDGGTIGAVTSITGNFVANTSTDAASANCAGDGLAAWTAGRKMTGLTPLAKIEDEIIKPGKYESTSLDFSTKVYLDAENDPNAKFVFNIVTTLTTSANSKIILLNGAKEDNIFWVLGTALTMGANSILMGNVLAGTSISMGTNAEIFGRAIAQTAITCGTACSVTMVPRAFTPIANDPHATTIFDSSKSTDLPEKIILGFVFKQWLGGTTISSEVHINSNGQITIGELDYPRIVIADGSLDPSKYGRKILTKQTCPESMLISWEGVGLVGSNDGTVVNAQAELFANGAVHICFGDRDCMGIWDGNGQQRRIVSGILQGGEKNDYIFKG